MLLQKIILDDFGVYRGHNEFDVSATRDKPIVLCGGKNGTGKTTLFESVPLCLYGQNSFDRKITQKQYHKIIAKSFHRYDKEKKTAEEASISIEFQYAHNGKTSDYTIIRQWQNIDGTIEETLRIKKKNSKGDFESVNISESDLQVFVDQLLPRGITNLFFFDGEKIQKMANFETADAYIKSSFESLLGLDVIKQLQTDMGLFILRNSDNNTKKILDELDENMTNKKKSEEKLGRIKDKQVFMRTEISGLQKKLDATNEKLHMLGGQFAKNRENLVAEKAKLEAKMCEIEEQMRAYCSDLLPLALMPAQLDELKKELEQEQKSIQSGFERDILEKNFEEISKIFKKENYYENIRKIFDDYLDVLPKESKIKFNLSTNDIKDQMAIIDKVRGPYANNLNDLTKSRNIISGQLEKINALLSIAPKQDEVGPVFSEITAISREIGEMEGELNRLVDLEVQEKSIIVILNSKIRKTLSAKKASQRNASGLEIAPLVQDVLEDYSRMLRDKKIQLLEKYILDGIRMFFHKKDFVDRVTVDSESFQIRLYERNGDEITREKMSKGELQLCATAIIWGLAKTSDRPLPFIIDTPLARLDMEHRQNMVSDFYPNASHQTIILSTDAEIVDTYYDELKDSISREITMQFDDKEKRTKVLAGYAFAGGKED